MNRIWWNKLQTSELSYIVEIGSLPKNMRSLLVLTGLVPLLLLAQSPSFINYSVREGMPSNEVYSIHSDPDGFLWFGTDNGVVRFDGKQMKIFHVRDGLVDPVVFEITEDWRGRLWFRSFSGRLCYYQDGKIHPYEYNSAIIPLVGRSYLKAIYYDSLDQLWLLMGGYLRMIDSTGKMKSISKRHVPGLICKIVEDGFLYDFMAPPNEVESIEINDKMYPVKVTDSQGVNIVCGHAFWNNKLYISIQSDIFEYSNDNLRRVYTGKANIISLSVDKKNQLWIGYAKAGVELFQHSSFNLPSSLDFLSNKSVSMISTDKDGGLWFSTLENGVYHVPDPQIKTYTSLINEVISDVTQVGDNIVVSDVGGGIFKIDNNHLTKKITLNSNILKLNESPNQKIWVSTRNQLSILQSNLTIDRLISLDRSFAKFAYDKNENCMWAVERYLDKFDGNGNRIITHQLDDRYRCLLPLDSMILLAGRVGLKKMNKQTFHMQELKDFSNDKISSMLKVTDSTLFIGTIGAGFHILNKRLEKIKSFRLDSNFVANNIYSAIITDSVLWFGTENGLYSISINELKDELPKFYILQKDNGLAGNKVDFLAYDSLNVYAFISNSFSVIPKKILSLSRSTPIFYIKDTRVNNQKSELKNKKLKHYENNIQMDFGFISFSSQEVFARYRLSKTDEWKYTKEPSINLFALASGNYAIEIESSTDLLHWTSINAVTSFSITPPLWERKWVQATSVLAILLVAFIFFRNRLSVYKLIQKHQQQLLQAELEALERERSRIARDLHDGIGVDIGAIKLNLGQLLKNNPQSEKVEKNLQQVMSDIKGIIFGLAPLGLQRYGLFETLRTYLQKIDTPLKAISFNTFGDPKLNERESINIFRIIQELIANSLKHSNGNHITVTINAFEDMISIIYEDNGNGFDYSTVKRGLGLSNIETRIQSMNGKFTFESGKFGITYSIDLPLEGNK